MSSEFHTSLINLLIFAFYGTVSMGFYCLAFHRPGLDKIRETGEPPPYWRYGMARYGYTELSTRLGALVFLVFYGVVGMLTAFYIALKR